jgi:hypothetical protein
MMLGSDGLQLALVPPVATAGGSSLSAISLVYARVRLRQIASRWSALLMICGACLTAQAGPLESLQPGHWYDVPNSQLKSQDPCPAANCSWSANEGVGAVMNDWAGGAFATGFGAEGGLAVTGGGHQGYYGNELYVFDVATLKWQRVTNPLDNPTCDYNEGELQDQSPCASHTYDFLQYHPGSNSFVQLGSTSNQSQGGGGSPRVHLFNFTTKQWRRGARRPSFNDQTGASSAYDPNRDVFWFLAPFNNYFAQYDPNANGGAGNWTLEQQFNIEIDGVAAVDPVHDLYVVLEGRVTHSLIVFDLKHPASPPVTAKLAGDMTMMQGDGHGFEWDPTQKAFVGWNGGTSVYVLTPPASNWQSGTWTWTRVDAAADNTVNPGDPNSNGTYSRWRYVPALNVYILANAVDRDVYFYKLSNATPLPQVSLQASALAIAANSAVTLTWSVLNADTCTASGAWSGSKGLTGTLALASVAATSTYTLTCSSGGGGAVSQSVTVNVGSDSSSTPPPSAPTVTLNANPATVAAGQATILSWSSTGASTCSASGAWAGNQATSGSVSSVALNTSSTFVLSCTSSAGASGTATASVAVTQTAASSPASTSPPASATAPVADSSTTTTAAPASGGGGSIDALLLALLTLTLLAKRLAPSLTRPRLLVAACTLFSSVLVGTAHAATLPSIVLTSTGSGTQTQIPVTYGQVFAPGDVPAGTSLVATIGGTAVPLQVDVKAHHGDGSVRHAILSLRIPSLAAGASNQVNLSTGAAGTGSAVTLASLLATSFDASVDLNVGGTDYTASARALLSSGTPKVWLQGPLVSEWIVGGPVKTSSGTAHPQLAAYFHVRAYGSPVDHVRVDVVIENGWLLVAGPGLFNYNATLSVGGQTAYTGSIAQPDHTRWHKRFWWPSAPQVNVQADTRYLQATKVVPTYAQVTVKDATLNGLIQSSTPMSNGDLTAYMPDTGSQPAIGPLPIWDARYIVTGADPRAYNNMLADDDSAGSYSAHYRDETTGLPFSIKTHPTLSLQTDGALPAVSGSNPLTVDNAHQPSIGFVSYLVTGDYFYLEEMLFYESWNELWMNADYRQQSKGIFGSQVRAQAWSLRSLAQAAYALPDDHPMKAELVAQVGYNIDNYASLYVNNPSANNLGAVASYDGYQAFAPWMDDFLTWVISYVTDLGFPAQAVRDWKFKFPVGRMGNTDYCYKEGAVYHLLTGTSDTAWYPSFAAVYAANFGANTSCPDGLTMDGYPDDPAGYPSNLRPALVAAVDNGYPGAADAWARFIGSAVQANYTDYPNWAMVPRGQLPASTATLSIAATPSEVASGATAQLTWTATNVSSCTASGGWSGAQAASGTYTTSALTAATTFALACTGSNGTILRSATVTIQGAAAPSSTPPTLTLSADSTSVAAGAGATLTWSTTDATACTASGGWSGSKATSGSQTTGSLSASTTFQLDCTGAAGDVSKSVTIAVAATPGSGTGPATGSSAPTAADTAPAKSGGGGIDLFVLATLLIALNLRSSLYLRARKANS